ncbi:MAG TPA: hypothetical protein VGZ29_14705 [Terriglobia bacterium]|nr:hypothetical protein [Terriglobia bacterium]
MFFAYRNNLGTHYDAVPPDLPAGIGFWPKYLWLAFFAQLVFWVSTTIVIGMLFGTVAAGDRATEAFSGPRRTLSGLITGK